MQSMLWEAWEQSFIFSQTLGWELFLSNHLLVCFENIIPTYVLDYIVCRNIHALFLQIILLHLSA